MDRLLLLLSFVLTGGANGFDLSAFDVILGGSPDMVLTGSDG